jgi:hypothetical protein
MPPRVAQLEVDVRLLTDHVRALTTDRDRLTGRIALLESSIDDMTGAIKRQAAATAALAAKAPPPAPSAPATTTPASAPTAAAIIARQVATPAAPPKAETAPAPKADTVPTGTVPLPPVRLAAAPASEPALPAVNQIVFGLDLGGGVTVDAVRQRWTAVKADFGPLLSGMHPLAAREHRGGGSWLSSGRWPTTQ